MGITFSSAAQLSEWAAEHTLPEYLLSDESREVGMAYGAADSPGQEKATRLSILVGVDGLVERVFDAPDPAGHADEVLAALG